jgi:D-glycero-D-manno-heptose 1,7-bisphosphate phosphatase
MHYSTAPTLSVAPFPWRLYTLSLRGEGFSFRWKDVSADVGRGNTGGRILGDGKRETKKWPTSRYVSYIPRKKPSRTLPPAVFLDRDGVINTLPAYYTGPAAMKLIPGSARAIRRLHEAGYAVVIVSNQSCVGTGYVTRDQLSAVFDRMNELLAEACGEAALPDASYFSLGAGERAVHPKWAPHDDAKPSPALIEKARLELGLSKKHCWMVGDRLTDLQAGAAAGCRNILVLTGNGADHLVQVQNESGLRDVFIEKNLATAADRILGA